MQDQNFTSDKYSVQNIIRNYQLLSTEDPDERERANKFLMSLADYQQTWITCQNMIKLSEDPNFIFLGAQLFYQKIQRDLHQFDPNFKIQLKNFLFEQLDSGKHKKTFIIDKLASSTALVVCSLYLNEWPNFMQDLTDFMKKSSNHLISGLIILERIPEELRMTNRIAQGIKTRIQDKFLQNQQLFSMIFDSVFQLKDEQCIQRVLKTLQSWIRICYPLMKYPTLIKKVLQNTLQNVQKLQMGVKVISQALKLAAQQKLSGLSQADPNKEQQSYLESQVQSLKIIITYTVQNKANFMSYINVEPQYAEMYLQLVQQLPLSYGFLVLEQIGFDLISIILELTTSTDLKLSFSTFQFWMDYSEKVIKMKLNEPIKQRLIGVFQRLFDTFTTKILIQNQNFMLEADLKDDETLDDADGMTFTEYRKQSSSLLKYIYDFFVKMKKQQGAQLYFKKVGQLLQSDNPPLNRYTQLALFLLKSPLQSMINPFQTSNIVSILEYLITKINTHQSILQIPPIVLGQTMNFIRDCTRQIKEKDQLFLEALKFVLNYINDEKLCHHAAYCFQILMETINTLNDPSIAQSLIQFYSQKKFTKQVVLQKILEGIFNAIIKVPDTVKVETYLDAILNTLFKKYLQCSKIILQDTDNRSQLYLSLVEIKTVLDSYDSSNSGFKNLYRGKFMILANKSIQIVNQILPLGISNHLRFSSINEVGLSISIYRVSLKILQIPQNFQTQNSVPSYLTSMGIVLMILNQKDITEYYYAITLLSQTLVQFINHSTPFLDNWLIANLPYMCSFFVQYYQNISKVDTDVIKMLFTVQQSLLLYNRNIFYQFQGKQQILTIALHALRNLNQRNMQRKIVSFLFLSLQNQIYTPNNFQTIVQNTFLSIPIIHSMCYTNLAKVFKYLFRNTSLQDKEKVFLTLLNQKPYQQIEQNIRNMLGKAISFALVTQEERHIKSIFVQLNQIVWKKVSSDTMMQLELKLAAWKRQYKKSLQEKSLNHTATL